MQIKNIKGKITYKILNMFDKDTIVDYTLDKYQDYIDDIYNEPPEYSYYGSDRD
mgnify:CR=1 FL=1